VAHRGFVGRLALDCLFSPKVDGGTAGQMDYSFSGGAKATAQPDTRSAAAHSACFGEPALSFSFFAGLAII
jgi:hypothetical protein